MMQIFSRFRREPVYRDRKTGEPFVASPRGLLPITEARARELEGLPPVKPSTQPTAKAPTPTAAPRPPAKPTTAPTAKAAPSVNIMDKAQALMDAHPELTFTDSVLIAQGKQTYSPPQPAKPEPVDIWHEIQAGMAEGKTLVEASVTVMTANPEAYDKFRRGIRA